MHLALVTADTPPPPIAPRPARATLPAETTWALPAIARMLGVHMRSPKWQVRYVELLIANEHFPRPLPTMKGDALVHDIQHRRSRWLPAAVTAWIAGRMTPEAAEAAETHAAREAADRLDAAADNLFAKRDRGGEA